MSVLKDRTRGLIAGLVVLTGTGYAAITASYGQSPIALTYVSYGGTGQDAQIKAWQEPYTANNPHITFTNTSPPDPAQVKAQVMTKAVQWNVVTTAPYLATQNCGTLYEKLTIPGSRHEPVSARRDRRVLCRGLPLLARLQLQRRQMARSGEGAQDACRLLRHQEVSGQARRRAARCRTACSSRPCSPTASSPTSMYPLDVERGAEEVGDDQGRHDLGRQSRARCCSSITSKQVDMQFLVQARSQAALDAGANMVPVWDITVTSVDGLAVPKGSPNLAGDPEVPELRACSPISRRAWRASRASARRT